jgi:hypothetical protein
MQSFVVSEESYCSPWDLKIQEEKFKLLNEQHQISSLSDAPLHPPNTNNQYTNKAFQRTCSVRTPSSFKKFITPREVSPPVLPPLPLGGLIPSCQCNPTRIENLDPHKTRSGTDTSRSFLFTSTSPSNKSTPAIDTNNTQSMSFDVCFFSEKISNNSRPFSSDSFTSF